MPPKAKAKSAPPIEKRTAPKRTVVEKPISAAKTIEIRCKGAGVLHPGKMHDFQGNLKTLTKDNYERLKRQILELGFSEPISVWEDKGKHFILNGHQRHRTVTTMISEGYRCPDLPVNFVEARSFEEAKKKVLSLTSQFGEMEREGLYEFVHSAGIRPDELMMNYQFSDFSVSAFVDHYFPSDKEKEKTNEDRVKEEESKGKLKEYLLVVECKNEQEQAKIYEELSKRGLNCKLM